MRDITQTLITRPSHPLFTLAILPFKISLLSRFFVFISVSITTFTNFHFLGLNVLLFQLLYSAILTSMVSHTIDNYNKRSIVKLIPSRSHYQLEIICLQIHYLRYTHSQRRKSEKQLIYLFRILSKIALTPKVVHFFIPRYSRILRY